MKFPENIREISTLPVDYMGFIFYIKSKRYVGDHFEMPDLSDFGGKTIAVFVNESIENIIIKTDQFAFDGIQLHGDETLSFCRAIKELRPELIIFKAFQIGSRTDLERIELYDAYCDGYILDTKSEDYGGTGKTWDYQLIHDFTISRPFLLSGGIGSDFDKGSLKNIHKNCVGIDVNSRFEIAPGLKNIKQLKQFVYEKQF